MSTNIKFVVNTIAHVENIPENDFDGDSEDEEPDDTFETYKADPPYIEAKFKYETQELVKTENINDCLNKLNNYERYESTVVDPLLQKLSKQAFRDDKNTAKDTISVCIYLNKMLSVSDRRNLSLILEMECDNIHDIEFKKFAYFWRCSWRNKNKKLTYGEVRKYYKQLKRKNIFDANIFLKQTEDKVSFVPYQQLRDQLKDHNYTKELVKNFRDRSNNENINIYLSIIDEDTINFNSIYGDYISELSKYTQGELPRVISTGYVFPKENYPLYLATEFDRQIRISIAKDFPLGIYYPEPNMCILIPENCNTVPESFINKINSKELTESNLESPILLRNIIQSAGKEIENIKTVFFDGNPIITEIPKRVKSVKFSEEFQNGAPPTSDDIEKFKEITQSNYEIRKWFQNLFTNGAITFINNVEYHINEIIRNKCKNQIQKYKDGTTNDEQKVVIKKELLKYMNQNTFKALTKTNAQQYCQSLISKIRKNNEYKIYIKEHKLLYTKSKGVRHRIETLFINQTITLINKVKKGEDQKKTKKIATDHCHALIDLIERNIKFDTKNIEDELRLYILPKHSDKIIKSIDTMEECIEKLKSDLIRTEDDNSFLNFLKENEANLPNFIKILNNQKCDFKDAVKVWKNIRENKNVNDDEYDPQNILIFVKPKVLELIDKKLIHLHFFVELDSSVLKSIFDNNKVIEALATKSCDEVEILKIIEDESNRDNFITLLNENRYSVDFIIEKYKENVLYLQFLTKDGIRELVFNKAISTEFVMFALDNCDILTEMIIYKNLEKLSRD